LPAIGFDGQERIVAATVAVVGDDLTSEVLARALAAAGVGGLRLVRRSGAPAPDVLAALAGSNPDVVVEVRAWPVSGEGAGAGWLAALDGCSIVARSGFDDDAMLRAAIRQAVPVVVVRADAAEVDLVSFRRHGPCPHVSLAVPESAAAVAEPGPIAVVAAHAAAAEVLLVLAEAHPSAARARHTRLALDGEVDGATSRSIDIPWTPECFACGGSASEMSFGG
jgi:hypothetical protein